MLRYALPTALAAALWTAALAPTGAQDKTDPAKPAGTPKTAPAPQANPTGAPQTAPVTQPAVPAAPPKPSDPNIVGSVGGKNILFMQVAERLRHDSPEGFKQAVAQAIGAKAADQLYGATPQPSVTITTEQAMMMLRDTPNPLVYGTLQKMLQEQALADTAAKENVVATDQQVNDYLAKLLGDLRKQGRIPPGVTDDQFLAQQRVSRPVLMDGLRSRLEIEKLMEKDAKLQTALQQQAAQTAGHPVTTADFLQARHILIATPPTQSANPADNKGADAAALAKANKIAAEVKSGKKTFEAAAKESSDDPGSKVNGGDLGVFVRGTMVPEFTKAAFAAKPGEVVGPVKSQFGYHIIRVDKQGKDLTEQQRRDALNALYQRFEQQNPQLTNSFMNDLMVNRARVVSYMTPPPQPQQPGFPGAQGG